MDESDQKGIDGEVRKNQVYIYHSYSDSYTTFVIEL